MLISFQFFIALILSLFIYRIIPNQLIRNIFISVVSLIFVWSYDNTAALIIVVLSIYSFIFGYFIERNSKKSLLHFLSVLGLIIILAIFKYLGFLINTFNSIASFTVLLPEFKFEKLLLPLGLSYIILKHISYLTDIKWGINKAGKFDEFLFYSSFFTIYFAGPIERFERFQKELTKYNLSKFDYNNIEEGFKRIVFGIFKKAVIADWLGYFIAPVFQDSMNHSFLYKSLALFGYSLQIYFDFSGYSDIAIGSSNLFGIKIMENFNNPYLKNNISQFWQNWHISLSSWIKDYLFFPLSRKNDNKIWILILVPLIAMSLCGLWHGPSWHFVLWGAYHGAGISVFQLYTQLKRKNKLMFAFTNKPWFNVVSIIITFVFVTIGWKFFRG